MAWERPNCNGGDCCKFYGRSNFRIVTNGHEFKIQEKRTTFWRGREYWADVEGDCDAFIDIFTPTNYYKTFEDAQKRLEKLERYHARVFGTWEPAEQKSEVCTENE